MLYNKHYVKFCSISKQVKKNERMLKVTFHMCLINQPHEDMWGSGGIFSYFLNCLTK
jgi:hypothetical protein